MPLLSALLVLTPAPAPFPGGEEPSIRIPPFESSWQDASGELVPAVPAAPPSTRRVDRPPLEAWWAETLPRGSCRLSYRFRQQSFDGLREGRDDFSSSELDGSFDRIPEEMTWTTHTLDLAWGVREQTTLWASLPFVEKELESHTSGGASYDSSSDGVGDVIVGLTRQMHETARGGQLLVHLGLGLPTGSTDEEDDVPGAGSQRLPYPMQIGTGTYQLHPGAYWIQSCERWSWGAGARWRVHLDRNDEGYAPGDTTLVQAWASRDLGPDLVGSLRLEYYGWGDTHGEDDELDPDVDPLNDPHRQGGDRIDVAAGVAWEMGGARRANRLEVDFGVPVDEWLDGPQLSTEWFVTAGWRFSF
jgi:hypothetical protein